MSNPRIVKKLNTRYLGEFLVDASQDPEWEAKLKALAIEDKLDTANEGMPAEFSAFFPETADMPLQYCIERVELNDVPRAASSWWKISDSTHYFMAYPAQFPRASVFLAIDFDEHDHRSCC